LLWHWQPAPELKALLAPPALPVLLDPKDLPVPKGLPDLKALLALLAPPALPVKVAPWHQVI
jgi:hypothetical protein